MTLKRYTGLPRGKGFRPRDPATALRRGTGLARTARMPASRKDTGASRAVRDMVFARDRWCVRCGKGLIEGRGGYSIHHLILRSHGVDNRVEAQVLACGSGSTGCHGWIHANPVEAMAAGWIRRGNARPGTGLQPVKVAFPDGYRWFVLLPDGARRSAEAPEGTAAA